ncbi:MAG: hypothetical protein IIW19_00690, partial [Clostridia bacterium]|nr:hypothetical protein [Clostridia bacterium]
MLPVLLEGFQDLGGFRRFSQKKQGTHGTVLNRITPQFPKSRRSVLSYYKSLREIRKGGKQ